MSEQTFMSIINELEVMLNKVDKSYYEFVDSIVFDCRAQGEEFTRSIVEFIEKILLRIQVMFWSTNCICSVYRIV